MQCNAIDSISKKDEFLIQVGLVSDCSSRQDNVIDFGHWDDELKDLSDWLNVII
jgi:hypothetical protein